MPGQNIGTCFVRRIPGAGLDRVRIQWESNSAGDCLFRLPPIEGILDSFSSYHLVSGSSGTYDASILDELGADMLDGLGAALAVNTTAREAVLEAQTDATSQSRPIRLCGPLWFKIDASTSATHYGTFDLLIRQLVPAAAYGGA